MGDTEMCSTYCYVKKPSVDEGMQKSIQYSVFKAKAASVFTKSYSNTKCFYPLYMPLKLS